MGMVWVVRAASDDDVVSLRADPESIYDFVNPEDLSPDYQILDLDKQWHAVHFLLTGSAGPVDSPLSFILGTYEEVGPDHGYGPAWFIPSEAIRAFHSALAKHSDEEWARRYDASTAVAEQVYLAETLADEGEEALTFLQSDIARLRSFVRKAVEAGNHAFALIT